MHRFFIAPENIEGSIARLDEDESRHMIQVMRLKPGDPVVLFDGKGLEYQARLEAQQGKSCQAVIEALIRQEVKPPMRLALAQGIPKGDKMDTIIQKAVEIGVDSIFPIVGKRSVVHINEQNRTKKRQRWDQIAREACKQCRRNWLPHIYDPLPVTGLLDAMGTCPGIVLYEGETRTGLKDLLENQRIQFSKQDRLFLLIGPEGGWDDNEVALLRQQNLYMASLGPRILRTETAGLVAASLVLYEYGDLGSRPAG